MKEKNKNRIERSEMLRYFNGEMTGRERHVFERRLQRELFSREAAEGLSEITGEQLGSDLEQLDKRLETRTSRKKTVTFLRIAASLAVLLVISSVFIILNRKNHQEPLPQLAVNKPVTMEIKKTEPLKESESRVVKSLTDVAATDQVIRADSSEATVPLKAEDQEVHEDIADAVKADVQSQNIPAQTEARPSEALAARQRVDAATASAAGAAMKRTTNVMEAAAVAGDTTKSDMNEIVVIGFGQEQKTGNASEGSSSASPVGGKTVFENYIRENIRKPASLAEGQRAAVVVSLMVTNTGAINDIIIESSPGQEFSDEATRLIKEGPSWKPAIENGMTINDKVRIKIVF